MKSHLDLRVIMRRVRAREDHTLAANVESLLRTEHGFDYAGLVSLYAKSNEIDLRTAEEEWEDLMQEAGYHST